MAWCEKCKGEYIDGIATCPKCGITLTEEPQTNRAIRKRQKQKLKRLKEENKNYKEAFLVNTNSLVEFNYITTNLQNMGISYRAIEEGSGQYLSILHGKSFVGSSVYVDEARLDEAKEVLNSLESEQEEYEPILNNTSDGEIEEEKKEAQEYGEPSKGVKLFKKAFRIVVVIIVAVFVVVMLYSAIKLLMRLFENNTGNTMLENFLNSY